ncbi:hypothetical protein JCM10212_005011 [Sporobolomyces blumeae]
MAALLVPHPMFATSIARHGSTRLAPAIVPPPPMPPMPLKMRTPNEIKRACQVVTRFDELRKALSRSPSSAATTVPLDLPILDRALEGGGGGRAPGTSSFKGARSVARKTVDETLPNWSVKALAVQGDAVWSQVVIDVLLYLDVCERTREGSALTNGDLTKIKGQLTTNTLGIVLAERVGLDKAYGVTGTQLQHVWEAHIAAVDLSFGRTRLLEYLAPIIKTELEARQRRIEKGKKAEAGRVDAKVVKAKNVEKTVAKQGANPTATATKVFAQTQARPKTTKANGNPSSRRSGKSRLQHTSRQNLRRPRSTPRQPPLTFPSLAVATLDLLAVATLDLLADLEKEKVEHVYKVSSSKSTASLQVPGYPLFAAKKKKGDLLAQIVKSARERGFAGEVCASTAEQPIVAENHGEAYKKLFTYLSTHGIKHSLVHNVRPGGRKKTEKDSVTLQLNGYLPIVGRGRDKGKRKAALVDAAVTAGFVRLRAA